MALFITHSALGLGTIVGSEIFNQLIICAGAVFAAKSGKLQLDKAVVIREVSFYALAILLLYLALQDTRPVDDDTEEHIYISFADACMVFAGYIAYVLVCAHMDKVVACFARGTSGDRPMAESNQASDYGSINYVTQTSIHLEQMPFLHEKYNLSSEPVGNFEPVKLYRTPSGGDHSLETFEKRESVDSQNENSAYLRRQSLVGDTLRRMASLAGSSYREGSYRPFEFLMHVEKPSDEHALYDVEHNGVSVTRQGGHCQVVSSRYLFAVTSSLAHFLAVRRTHFVLHVEKISLLQQGSLWPARLASSMVQSPR